jgi:hypothetical protein
MGLDEKLPIADTNRWIFFIVLVSLVFCWYRRMRGRLLRHQIRLHILVHRFQSLVLISDAQALCEFCTN